MSNLFGTDTTEPGIGKASHIRPPRGDRGRCKSCGAPVVWVKTAAGKRMPADADTGRRVLKTKGGRLRVVLEDGSVIAAEPAFSKVGSVLGWTSHFATCPDAAKHRKGGS